MSEPSAPPSPAEQSFPAVEISPAQGVAGEAAPLVSVDVGQQLRAAREARNMSLAEAAQSLKLAPRQVEALEAEDWAALPGNTMIRGFVRNYARLLNIESDLLMRGLDAAQLQQTLHLEISAGTSASLPQAGRRVERRDYLAALAGLLLLGLAVLAYFYVPADFWRDKLGGLLGRGASQAPVEEPAPPPPVVAVPKAAVGESVTVLATPHTTLLSDMVAPSRPAEGSAASAGGGLKLSFAQPAWVEVRDGRGQTIFAELGSAGSQREIDGQPPFSLVVGNAANVKLEYRGRAIELAPRSKDDVARLTVE
ncbi:helix-turn-helix domain-containing protein [Accumulibacter sp.]|uniref:helix-turn-helix domain-containing protein n=1 Tax=Accumulibacter sp. TaxID=2053492 RepID=UPI002B641426|nr:helix-turn-helix domain-containing protein [Accumulibacter sp.]HPU81356.1 helix-turn-helix domain-containing protein [Accumulibacter sp.]